MSSSTTSALGARESGKKAKPKVYRFGKYRLLSKIGMGGMADVFLAVVDGPAGFTKLTVVKRMRETVSESPDFITMFVDEARIAARLNHPNVVQTNEVGEVDGKYYLAMEYLDGQPLSRVWDRARREKLKLAPEFSIMVLIDTLRGLQHAHDLKDYDGSPMNIVHRDVTPQNIFLTYDGQVKVVDFGIAKARGRSSETREGVIKGKIRYMAPEQATRPDMDYRADIFAVGCMLFDCISGRRMWDGIDEDLAILHRLIAGDYPRSPRAFNPDVPEALDAICQKALAHARTERYQSAEEFRQALESFLIDSGRHAKACQSLSTTIGSMFAEKRAETRQMIESHLAAMTNNDVTELNVAELDQGTASGSLPRSGVSSASRSVPRVQVGRFGPTVPPPEDLSAQNGESTATSVVETGLRPEPKRPRRTLLIGSGVLAVALCAVGAYAALKPPRAREIVVNAAPVEAPATPASPAADTKVKVSLHVDPPMAQMTIDGTRRSTPFEGTFQRDQIVHDIAVSFDGYEPVHEQVTFTTDIDRTFVLRPTARKGPAAYAPARPASARGAPQASVAAPAPAPAPTTNTSVQPASDPALVRKKRTIDAKDPYENQAPPH